MHMARIGHINDRHNDDDLPGTDIVYVVFVQYEVLDDVLLIDTIVCIKISR